MAYESTETITPAAPRPPETTPDGHTIIRKLDGTIEVEGPAVTQGRIPKSGDFDENLAELMTASERRALAQRLVEFAQVDRESRKDWEEREKTALEMMGVKDIEKARRDGEDDGDGHNLVHPMLMEAAARFNATALPELFPPNGPAETKVLGAKTKEKEARAQRVRTFLNHYLTEVDEGYFPDSDKMLMYLPMGGSVFRRAGQDFTTGLPSLRHVKASQFIAPYAGTDLKSMPRYAWAHTMTGEDIDTAMQIGMFVDLKLPQPAIGEAKHDGAADKSDAREPIVHEQDRIYEMLEYHVELSLPCDRLGAGLGRPTKKDNLRRHYMVVVDASNQETLMVRRNWRQKDKLRRKRIWFAHHRFLPGLGFYGWGYCHVIGSLGSAASGAVNALLDAALAASWQGGFRTKEGRVAGEQRLEHGVWKEVDCTAEDLAKSFYTPPFKEPAPALFSLLENLVTEGQRFAGTTDAAVGQADSKAPVGTTVALIEQASKPQTAIHHRLHVSMTQELKMLCELIHDYMPTKYDYQIGDQAQFLLKADFAPGVDVVCVTDPAVASDTQRIMRAQAVIGLQKEAPQIYPPQKIVAAHRRMLVALKVPNVDEIAPEWQGPRYLDAVGENAMIFAGKPVRVFPEQDDRAHMQIHQDGVARAQALFPPEVLQQQIMPAMQAHIRDHMASSYVKQIMTGAGLKPQFAPDGTPMGLNPQQERAITARVAAAIAKLPHPQPKPGTPNAEQLMAQAKANAYLRDQDQIRDQKEQAFQAEERRKQEAFENEEKRKDQALNNQEARQDTATATKIVRGKAEHRQGLEHNEDRHAEEMHQSETRHLQDLTQDAQTHEAQLSAGSESHQQDLLHAEQSHQQGARHADEQTAAQIQRGDQLAKAAESEESDAETRVP